MSPWEQPPTPDPVWHYREEPLAGVYLEGSTGEEIVLSQDSDHIVLDVDPECWEALAAALLAMAADYREGSK